MCRCTVLLSGAAFNASAQSVLLLDAHNRFAGILPLSDVTLTEEDGTLLALSSGGDPALALPACAFARGKRHVLRLSLSYASEDELQVFYGTRAQRHWSEAQSVKAIVRQGRGDVFVELAAAGLAGPLRLDPGRGVGEYRIHSVEARAVPG
jgi:hypothetical protein